MKPPKTPAEEILEGMGEEKPKGRTAIVGPFTDLPTLLSQVKGKQVEMWRETGGRRAEVPGPYDGAWTVDMLKEGAVKVPPMAVFKDISTGTMFRLDMSMEVSTVQPNGYGQQSAQPLFDGGRVITAMADMLMKRLDAAEARNRELEERIERKDAQILSLEKKVAELEAADDDKGILETAIKEFSRSEDGRAMIMGGVETIAERFSSKSKPPA
jgi:hypothetical protein